MCTRLAVKNFTTAALASPFREAPFRLTAVKPAPAEARAHPLRAFALPIYGSTFLLAAGLGATIPIVPLFARELGGGVGLAGLAVAMRGLGTLALDVPAGLLVSRFDDRRVMTWGAALTAAAAAATVWAGSVAALLALLFATGGALALWAMARLHFLAEQVPEEARGRALSLAGGTGRCGVFVGPAVGGVVAEQAGLAAAFALQGLLTAGGVVALAAGFRQLRRRERRAPVTTSAPPAAEPGLGALLRTHVRPLLGAGGVSVVLQMLRTSRQLLVPLWGHEVGLGVAEIGLIVALSGGVDMLLFYPAGQVMDRRGRRATGVPSLALLSLGLALLPFASGFASLLAVGLLLGLGNGLSAGFVMTLGADLSPAAGRSRFLGIWRLVGDVGSAGGPMAVGALAAAVSLPTAATATAAVGVAGALLLAFVVGETRGRRPG